MLRRLSEVATVALLAMVMLGADGSDARYSRVGHKLMCACSCGQVLVECNHVGCPDSDRMLGELRGQLAGGSDDRAVLNWFAAKYGAIVLAAPIRGGFDTVAWIAPAVVFLFATVGTGYLVSRWARRRGQVEAPVMSVGQEALRARVRRETEF